MPWVGGKRLLARRLAGMIDVHEHGCYVEPFIGGGGVFFNRQPRKIMEVVNDRNRELATLMRVLQRHPDALLTELSTALRSRAEFERLRAQPADLLTDIERASRFYSLQRMAFGGKAAKHTFGIDTGASRGGLTRRLDMSRLEAELRGFHRRLSGVTIECLDWAELIPRYDRPHTLFYIDPPYIGHESDYGPDMFAPADHERLAETLRDIRGEFILSINDREMAHDLYSWAHVEPVETSYSSQGEARARRAPELIVSNLDPHSRS